jgi:hypothetical protein
MAAAVPSLGNQSGHEGAAFAAATASATAKPTASATATSPAENNQLLEEVPGLLSGTAHNTKADREELKGYETSFKQAYRELARSDRHPGERHLQPNTWLP